MKFRGVEKVCTFIFFALFFFSLFGISCSKKMRPCDNEVVFDTIQVDKTKSINYKESKLSCNLQIKFTYPVSCKKSIRLSDLQKMFIEKNFPSQYADLSPQEAVNNFSAQYISDFQSIKFQDIFEDDYIFEGENNFIYELNLENAVLYNRNDFISFVVKSSKYEGGAHSSKSICGYVIDLNSGKFLTEEDFAGNNYKKNLSSVIIQKIIAAKGLSDVSELEDVGYNAIENIVPNENFTIDDKGITYYFNENEIAAHFVGATEVFISYDELKTFITNDNPISSLAGL